MKKFLSLIFVLFLAVFMVACESGNEKEKTYSLSIDETEITLNVGETKEINATYEGSTPLWVSTNPNVASVENGKITAIGEGTCIILVTLKDNSEINATITVTVTKKSETEDPVVNEVESVKIEGARNSVKVGEQFNLTAVVEPTSETDKVVWESSNPSVATVTNGMVTALASGTAVISAKAGDKVAKFTLTVISESQEKLPEELYIYFSKTEFKIGEIEELEVEIEPKGVNTEYVWSLDKEGIVIIENNVIRALKGGVVTVTATSVADPSVKDSYEVRVYDNIEGMKITGQAAMRPGGSGQLFVEIDEVRPDGTPIVTNSEVKWESLNPDIVTVDELGVARAIAGGEATIRATALDSGGFVAEFKINVVTTDIYIGATAYGTIQLAIDAAKAGDTITIGSGSLSESFVINKSNITITGKDAELCGHIQLADGVQNVKFYELTFASGGYVDTVQAENAVGVKNITFDKCRFNNVSSKVDGTIHFFVPVKGFVFTNNEAYFVSNRGIRFELPVEDITIDSNEFYGVDNKLYDMVRAMDLASGSINITNNIFEDTAQSFIQIRYIGNGTYNITGNEFNNAAKTCVDLREAKENNFQGKAIINIKDNNFVGGENGWGVIRVRNSYDGGELTNPSQVEVSINNNSFKEIVLNEETHYVDKPLNCTEGLFNIDSNYSDLGLPKADWFSGMAASFDNWFGSQQEQTSSSQFDKINKGSNYVVVGSYPGITKNGYATLAAALKAAKSGDTIVLLPGTYSGHTDIKVNNITITTLNGDISPLGGGTRYDEVIFKGSLGLVKELKNCTISGIKFTGSAQITNEMGDGGSASDPKTNLDGFNFINNIVETSAIGKGFIYFVENKSSGYSYNINISNNKFKTTSSFSGDAVVYIDNNCNLKFTENLFEDIKATYAFYINDETKGMSGQSSIIEGNTFKNVTGNGIWINWMSPLPNGSKTAEVSVKSNTFNNVSGEAIHFGKMNNSDGYQEFKVTLNSFTKVGTAIYFVRVTGGANIECNLNTFADVPSSYYIVNDSANSETSGAVTLNATSNLFLDGNGNSITPSSSKFSGDIDYNTSLTGLSDLPSSNALATSIQVTGSSSLLVGDKSKYDVTYNPSNITNIGVSWSSSNESVAKVDSNGNVTALKAGSAVITATYKKNKTITSSITVTVNPYQGVNINYSGNGILKVNDEVTLTATSTTGGTIVWSTSDASVATVTNGKVKALKSGTVTITATLSGTQTKASLVLQVSNTQYSELMQLLINGHNSVVECKNINYIGYESGYTSVAHKVYTSVNDYYAADLPSITQNPCTNDTNSGTMTSIEYIVVHDTGAASPNSNAKANSNWCTNKTNTNSSWHYTVGNDAIYQQLADNVVAWHAGDGTGWSGSDTFYDTGITADPNLRNRAKVTLGTDGYFYVNGIKTNIPLPSGATAATGTNALGITAIVKNGRYYLPKMWVTSGYGNVVAMRGGNMHGIGIESTVNTGSDVYLTWQRLAKFVASLLVKHNLTPERIFFHNSFANKTCPNTMINSNMVETFLDMAYLEYYVAKDYSDYTITFTSNDPTIIDNSGRVIGSGPSSATNVSYTITITRGSQTESVTLYSLIQGNR